RFFEIEVNGLIGGVDLRSEIFRYLRRNKRFYELWLLGRLLACLVLLGLRLGDCTQVKSQDRHLFLAHRHILDGVLALDDVATHGRDLAVYLALVIEWQEGDLAALDALAFVCDPTADSSCPGATERERRQEC